MAFPAKAWWADPMHSPTRPRSQWSRVSLVAAVGAFVLTADCAKPAALSGPEEEGGPDLETVEQAVVGESVVLGVNPTHGERWQGSGLGMIRLWDMGQKPDPADPSRTVRVRASPRASLRPRGARSAAAVCRNARPSAARPPRPDARSPVRSTRARPRTPRIAASPHPRSVIRRPSRRRRGACAARGVSRPARPSEDTASTPGPAPTATCGARAWPSTFRSAARAALQARSARGPRRSATRT